jgi:molybdenum cofactor cytidylyltransferase
MKPVYELMAGTEEIAAVVLAAGESRRFGGHKQLARLGGRTLLEHVLLRADAAGLRPIIAVVPIWLTRPASASDDLIWVRNPAPERGMSHSLRLGLTAVPPHIEAAIVLLGDQPTVTDEVIGRLIAARGTRPIVAGVADGIVSPPLLIERSHFGAAEELHGDIGLRGLLTVNPEWVTAVDVDAHPPDVDTPDDLVRLRDDR